MTRLVFSAARVETDRRIRMVSLAGLFSVFDNGRLEVKVLIPAPAPQPKVRMNEGVDPRCVNVEAHDVKHGRRW